MAFVCTASCLLSQCAMSEGEFFYRAYINFSIVEPPNYQTLTFSTQWRLVHGREGTYCFAIHKTWFSHARHATSCARVCALPTVGMCFGRIPKHVRMLHGTLVPHATAFLHTKCHPVDSGMASHDAGGHCLSLASVPAFVLRPREIESVSRRAAALEHPLYATMAKNPLYFSCFAKRERERESVCVRDCCSSL